MGRGERFKLHGPEHGGRLEDQIALGDSNWARRFVTVREEAVRAEGDRFLAGEERLERARAAVSKVGKRGRPRVIEGEPWAAEGVSRKTWERRRKKGGGGAGI